MTYFQASMTMPDPQTSDSVRYGKLCQRFLWHQLALTSCEFCLNDLIDGDVKISSISIFSHFYWFSNMILSDALILPVSQLQT